MTRTVAPGEIVREDDSLKLARDTTVRLLAYCRANDWAGYDPYDALNSPVFKALPFLDFRFPRIVLTQMMKRSPMNFRSVLRVPPTQNPKGLALFLSAFLKLSRVGLLDEEDLVGMMAEKLGALRSKGSRHWCWGYSFPWQTRTILVPKGAPNLVCTTFVANALLDAYEGVGDSQYLGMAVSAAEYLLDELYWTEGDSVAGFSYPLPSSRGRVHNANFLGAALLCRVSRHCGDKKFIEPALKVARYSAARQHKNGSWDYGELPTQRWIDNFHTGYNLCALRSINENTATSEFEPEVRLGLEFYRNQFFREDGAPGYFHDRIYPIDIHSAAQSIITLLTLRDLHPENVGVAFSVLKWTIDNMWDERGYFYYQVFPLFTSKISYMRWSQAWMLLAMSVLLEEISRCRTSRDE
jgi:hypothetical protein